MPGFRVKPPLVTPAIVLRTVVLFVWSGIGEPVGPGVGRLLGAGDGEARDDGDGDGANAVVEIVTAEAVIEVVHVPLPGVTRA